MGPVDHLGSCTCPLCHPELWQSGIKGARIRMDSVPIKHWDRDRTLELIGHCCYGGLKYKRDCATCAAWTAVQAPEGTSP
jgi:hypothetical protein